MVVALGRFIRSFNLFLEKKTLLVFLLKPKFLVFLCSENLCFEPKHAFEFARVFQVNIPIFSQPTFRVEIFFVKGSVNQKSLNNSVFDM